MSPEGFADLAPGIGNRDDEPIYPRAGRSAFAGTPLAGNLSMQQVTKVVIGLAQPPSASSRQLELPPILTSTS